MVIPAFWMQIALKEAELLQFASRTRESDHVDAYEEINEVLGFRLVL
ncbi:MAG: hypothetical protein LC808_44920 [Actinobacteria bacterium]|nr:hypothetical protein [Actinomycetota bacterium]